MEKPKPFIWNKKTIAKANIIPRDDGYFDVIFIPKEKWGELKILGIHTRKEAEYWVNMYMK